MGRMMGLEPTNIGTIYKKSSVIGLFFSIYNYFIDYPIIEYIFLNILYINTFLYYY
jgi:hypothetical protein